MQTANSLPPPSSAAPASSTPLDAIAWQQAAQQWAQQQAGRKGAPFYPIPGTHPAAYSALWGGQVGFF